MAEFFFGVDFGASNLKCVRVDGKKIRPIRLNTNDDGSFHTPNAIFYRKNTDGALEKVIGQKALNYGAMSSENFIVGLKRKLEIKNWRQFIPTLDREVDAAEAAGDVFEKIFSMASRIFETGDTARAVVTVPVIFSKSQRNLIAAAATKAGFHVDAVINEAFAAMFAAKNLSDSLNVIFDFGGSTLDVSIIQIDGTEIHELAAAGLRLGGLDIDRDVLEKILRPKFASELDAAWNILNKIDFQLDFARLMKEAVYENENVDEPIEGIEVGGNENLAEITLSRAEVDAMLEREGYGGKITALLDELFENLADQEDCFSAADVTKIWAVGGSMHIPYFRAILENYFGNELFSADDYEFDDTSDFVRGIEDKYLAVAGGAANFLIQRENFSTTNAIPYRVCYSLGNIFRQGIDKNKPAGFETLYLPLNLAELDEAGWKLDLYQTFGDGADLDDAAFLESIALKEALYEKNDAPKLKMKMMRDGRLRLQFLERRLVDDEREMILVEQHFVKLEA